MPSKPPLASVERRLPRVGNELAYLALGGGSDPLSNQISIEQDIELATSLLAGPGLTMFASGPGAQVAVDRRHGPRTEARKTRRDAARERDAHEPQTEDGEPSVLAQVAELLGPPGATQVEYQPAKLAIDTPATRDHVLDALKSAIDVSGEASAQKDTPLLVFAAGHGERGAVARENALSLWGGWSASVEDFADVLEASERVRPTRMVIMACYGGGFAELAFTKASPQYGTRTADHCGLFAAPADDESSGCDPNPDRREQESYAIHFLHALGGRDRELTDRRAEIDLDHDDRISLREAHAFARIHSHSFDIPTSTSERYLREYTRSFEQDRPARGVEPYQDREEQSVMRALSSELELTDEQSARAKLRELDQILEDAGAEVDQAQRSSDDAYYALRIALLERWPLLDHTWDPRALTLATREAAPIMQLLSESELAQGNGASSRELSEALAQQDAVRIARARVLRLVRAFETLRLAGALARRGGPRYEHYVALRECERFAPTLRAPLTGDASVGVQKSDAVEAEAQAK